VVRFALGVNCLTVGENMKSKAMVTLTFSLPDSLKDWIDSQVGEDGYASASEYVIELVRQDHERLEELRRIADEGLASGVSAPTFEERIADGDRIIRKL
jgi:antitoxin ParD1/3/4